MSNPLYESLKYSQPMNIFTMLNQLRSNPVEMIRQAGFNIPDGISNPQQMIGYLLQSGQVPQSRFAQAQQMAMRMKR